MNLITHIQAKIKALKDEIKAIEYTMADGIETPYDKARVLECTHKIQVLNEVIMSFGVQKDEPSKKKEKSKIVETDNWMLQESLDTVNRFWDDSSSLVNQITIDKIEYGRICMGQIFFTDSKTLDLELQQKIKDLGGVPKTIFNSKIESLT